MNDLDLLDQFGPSADEPADAALAAARARLASVIDAPTLAVRRTRRLPLLVAASVVAAAGVGVAVTPALVGSDHSIALAAVDPLTFPVTPTWLPAGIGDPVFDYDSGRTWVRYGSGDDRIGIDPHVDGDEECRGDRATRLQVNGQSGWGYAGCADEPTTGATNAPTYIVEWEQPDGDVVAVGGHGKYADPALVERVAASVEDDPQPVDLFLTIAPQGWHLHGYQSDHHVLWSDPDADAGGDSSDLTVGLIARVQDDLSDYGARDVRTVAVDGRRGLLGRQVDEGDRTVLWILQSTAPDGRAFSLSAPGRLTEEQVIEIAAGVRHR